VGELRLRIRAPADRASAVRPEAEAFAREVLSRCEARLSASAPGRVVLMRRLDMRWRLLEGALGHEPEMDAFAAELADRLEPMLREAARVVAPAPDGEVAVFEDEAHWRAEHLAATAEGGATAWFFAPLAAEGRPPGALLRGEKRALAMPVLERLLAQGRLAEVLGAMSSQELATLAASVGTPEQPTTPAGATRRGAAELLESGVAAESPRASGVVARLCAHVAARAAPASPSTPQAGRARPLRGADAPPAEAPADAIRTDFGGLFYLLRLVMELGLGESLWRACLPEGWLLAEVARLLLGPAAADDPAPGLFGGVTSGRPPQVSLAQQEEVSASLSGALRVARQRTSAVPASSPVVPAHGRAPLDALLAQAAGSLQQIFLARAGTIGVETSADFVEHFLRVPAHVTLEDGAMDVRLPMDRIDLRVRRAGLDADPGWIPWLERRVTLTFEDGAGARP
jgi:hypothetical protein